MIIDEPVEDIVEVRADSVEAEDGFRIYDELEEEYDYYLPLRENCNFGFHFTNSRRDDEMPLYIPVLNIKEDCMGIIKVDRMVEPVNIKVLITI